MKQTTHSRPHLDHLRRQAKELLAELPASDSAAQTFIDHLPAARGMTPDQVRRAGLRLADAQSAIARKEGFASWPGLAAHVQALRGLEGTWLFESLEIDGVAKPPAELAFNRMLIDGDRFRMESPEAQYDGIFNIDVEARSARISIHFLDGPEQGHTCEGLFELAGDTVRLCLALPGALCPAAFATRAGSGHVLELLRRSDARRPQGVTGLARTAPQDAPLTDLGRFTFEESDAYARLAGTWEAVAAMRDGMTMLPSMLATGVREGVRNEVRAGFGGRTVVDAYLHIEPDTEPVRMDYLVRSGPARGSIQHGIMRWHDNGEVTFCVAPAGSARPADFASPAGSGITLSRWRRR